MNKSPAFTLPVSAEQKPVAGDKNLAHGDQKPVAKLLVEAYREYPAQEFPLYAGHNYVGRDPDQCTVCLAMPFIAARHVVIELYDPDDPAPRPFAMARDIIERPHTELSEACGIKMRRAEWYELPPGRRLSICGVINCCIEVLRSEDDKGWRTRSQQQQAILWMCRGRQYRERTVQLEEYMADHGPYGPSRNESDEGDAQSVPVQDENLCTLSMLDPTQSISYDNNPVVDPPYSPDHFDDSQPYSRSSSSRAESETTLTAPCDEISTHDIQSPQQLGESEDSNERRDPLLNMSDAPTQILGSSEQENFLFDTLSASADVSGPHSIRDQPAVIEPEHVESTQPLAAVQIEDDAPTHIQNFATYLPEVVSNTQSTQEVPNTLSLSRSSRAESAEAVSQEYTQVYPLNVTAVTAEHLYSNTTRIPSTPTDLLNEREYSKDSEDHKVSNETKEDDSTSVIPHTQEDQIEESLEQSTLEPAPLSGPSTASEGMSMDQPLDVLEPGVATSGPGASTEEVSTTTAPSSPARSPSLSKATNTTPQPVTDTSSQRTVSPPPTPQEREQSPGESSTRPTQGRDHSPKHGMDGDSDSDEPLKRARNIKRESTDEGSFSLRRATPSRILSRRSTTDLDHRPCVGFSCGDKSQLLTRYETIVKQLHWTKSEDNFSVLVFSSASRTAKFMMSIVKGIPIVSTEWLDECSKQRSYVPWEDFLFKGQELEEKYGFDLQNTCVIAKDNRALGIYLFSGLQFYFVVKQGASKKILEDGFLNTTLVKESLTPLVDVCGGKVIRKEPKEEDKEITVVIGPEPLPSALPDVSWDKTQSLIRRGFKVFTKEFILSTILQQKTDFKLYQIPPDDSASTNSGPSTRKRM